MHHNLPLAATLLATTANNTKHFHHRALDHRSDPHRRRHHRRARLHREGSAQASSTRGEWPKTGRRYTPLHQCLPQQTPGCRQVKPVQQIGADDVIPAAFGNVQQVDIANPNREADHRSEASRITQCLEASAPR